ncbi:MAG TPA: hypothetical protein VF277_00415 [Steroidobacteraceae bacterium]
MAASCTSALNWTAQAFTGNALGGTNFVSPTGSVTATAGTTVACALQFLTQPANTTAGTNITSVVNSATGAAVQVEALVNGAVATDFAGQVTLAPNPSSGTLANGTATAAAGIASFGSSAGGAALTLSPPGTYTLTASATGFTSATSASFKIFAGVLACGDPFASSFVNPYNIAPDQPGYAAGMRNGYNKDGVSSACVQVLYTFTNNILTSNQVQLSWDTSSQPNAAFEYTINWQAQAVGPSGWPTTPRPGLAWLNSDGSSTSNAANSASTPAFIPGLACLSNKLPAPYGSLQAPVAPSDTQITVAGIAANPLVPIPNTNPTEYYAVPAPGQPAVPATPFPIVIADTVNGVQSTVTERMTASSIASISPDPSTVNTASTTYTGTYTIIYNVTRGTATEGYPSGYPGGTLPSHASGTLVVSTPLPIIPNNSTTFQPPYVVQTQAQMCIADHGFQAFGSGSGGQVMFWTTVIDIGDGVVKGSF